MDLDANSMLENYIKWLRTKYKINHLEKSDQIVTPFTNNINDNINIYIDKLGNEEFILSDDGETLNDLSLNGIELTSAREKMLERILLGTPVYLDKDELVTKGNNNDFPEKKHIFIQTILRVNDLLMTRRSNTINLFTDEVNSFLRENEIFGTSGAKLTGMSGLDYRMDYIIPPKKDKPEMFIQFFNHLSFNELTNSAFIFDDIQKQRDLELLDINKSEKKIIANDNDFNISSKVYKAAESRNIEILPFSKKSKLIDSLV